MKEETLKTSNTLETLEGMRNGSQTNKLTLTQEQELNSKKHITQCILPLMSHILDLQQKGPRLNGCVDGDLIPSENVTFDLGSPSNRFRDVYLSGNTIYLGDAPISASQTQVSLGSTLIAHNTTGNTILTGNVGIGTTNPSDTLHVWGDASIGQIVSSEDENSRLTLWSPTSNGGTTNPPVATESVLMLNRSGVEGQTFSNIVDFRVGRYENTIFKSSTKLDIHLGEDATNNVVNKKHVMTLQGNGNVGIGTTNPSGLLQLYGNSSAEIGARIRNINASSLSILRLQNDNTSDLVLFFNGSIRGTTDGGSNTATLRNDAGDLRLQAKGQGGIHIKQTSGNVGIGWASPSQKLSVAGGILASASGSISEQGAHLQWNRTNGGGETWLINQVGSGYSNGIRFGGSDTSNNVTEWMRIDNGNVGIGTITPGEKLNVVGNLRIGASGTENYIAFSGTTGDTGYITTYIGERIYSGSESSELLLFKGNDVPGSSGPDRIRHLAEEHRFDTYTSALSGTFSAVGNATASTRMIVLNNGNVGIGVTNPINALVVAGSLSNSTPNQQQGVHMGVHAGQYAGIEMVSAHGGWIDFSKTNATPADFRGRIRYFNDANQFNIYTNGNENERMIIDASGFVQIGSRASNVPRGKLYIKNEPGTTRGNKSGGKAITIAHGHFNDRWNIETRNGNGTDGLSDPFSDIDLCIIHQNAVKDGELKVVIKPFGSNVTLNFTGQHRCFVDGENYSSLQSLVGLIVVCNKNEYIKMSGGTVKGKDAITIAESLPVVSLSTNAMDKRCFGVICMAEDPENREDQFGHIVTPYKKEKGDTRAFINSVGEGAIWVTNANGNFESGDYITTSNIPGYGMRQNDDLLHNYTVAKITMDCDFTNPSRPKYKIKKEIEPSIQEEQGASIEGEIAAAPSSNEESEESGENVLDVDGNLIWEQVVDDNGNLVLEESYNVRFISSSGEQMSRDEYNTRKEADEEVYIAAFVGCTYHCG